MRVVITEERLKAAGACPVYLKSPEWDAGERALVYADWAQSAKRLLSTRAGISYLGLLVGRGLVPMTVDAYKAALRDLRAAAQAGG